MMYGGSLDLQRGVQALFYPSKSKVSAHRVWTLGQDHKQKLETLARTFFFCRRTWRLCRHCTSAKYAPVSGHYVLEYGSSCVLVSLITCSFGHAGLTYNYRERHNQHSQGARKQEKPWVPERESNLVSFPYK